MPTLQITTTAERLRASHVKRWGIVHTAYTQSVAEHMWRVWLLARDFGASAALPQEDIGLACGYALVHDLPEIRTGDAPTPHKTPELKAHLEETERAICPEVSALQAALTPMARALWKLADTAEAVLYLQVNGLGMHARDVQSLLHDQLLDRLHASDSPFTDIQRANLGLTFHRILEKT